MGLAKVNGFADGKWETARSISPNVWLDRIGEVSAKSGDFMGNVGDPYSHRGLAPEHLATTMLFKVQESNCRRVGKLDSERSVKRLVGPAEELSG